MAEKGPPAPKLPPTSKTIKTKATDQAKAKDPSQKTPPKKDLPKQNPPLEPEVVVVSIDQAQNQAPPNPQNPPVTNLQHKYMTLQPLPNLPAHIPKLPTTEPSSTHARP